MAILRDDLGCITNFHGLNIQTEVQMGRYRQKMGKRPVLMAADYGEIIGTTGSDGDAVDCYIGVFPECMNVYIINQTKYTGEFDEHKVMLGFLSQEDAVTAYQLSTFGKDPMSVIPCTSSQLQWWLEHGNLKAPVNANSFPFDPESDIAMNQNIFDWSNEGKAVSQALYQMRHTDTNEQLLEAASFDSVVSEIIENEEGEFAVFDALVIQHAKLTKTAQVIGRTLNRFGGSAMQVVENGVQVTDPFKKAGTTNVAMVFELSDGQTVSCFLHNPDKSPNKLQADDNLVAWRWNLNKKDITILVAKENGKDQEITQIAKRIMAFAEKNSARFTKANTKRAERQAALEETEARIAGKEQTLADLVSQIEAIKTAKLSPDTPETQGTTEVEADIENNNEISSPNTNSPYTEPSEANEIDVTPSISVSGNEFGVFDLFTKEGINSLREAAYQHLRNLFTNNETVFCDAINDHVSFNSAGAKKFRKLSGNPVKNQLAFAIKQIIAQGELVKSNIESYNTEERKMGITYDVLRTKVSVNDIEYGARTVLRKLPDGKYQYDMQVKDSFEAIMDGVKTMGGQSMSAYESDVIVRPVLGSEDLETSITHDDDTSQVFDKADIQTGAFVMNLFVDVKNEQGEWVPLSDAFEPDEHNESEDAPLEPVSEPVATPLEAPEPQPDQTLENVPESDLVQSEQEHSTTDGDIEFLNGIIAGTEDVMGNEFHDRLEIVAVRINEGDKDEMKELLVQAIDAYTAKLDELSKE